MTLPAPAVFLSTVLMTLTTIYLMSWTVKNDPEEENQRSSQHTWAYQKPYQWWQHHLLQELGATSSFSSEWPLIFSLVNLQVMWAVWQSSTGLYPALIWPDWFKIITLSCKASYFHWWVIFAVTSCIATMNILTSKSTLSPGRESLRGSWCISIDFTSVVTLTGEHQSALDI